MSLSTVYKRKKFAIKYINSPRKMCLVTFFFTWSKGKYNKKTWDHCVVLLELKEENPSKQVTEFSSDLFFMWQFFLYLFELFSTHLQWKKS